MKLGKKSAAVLIASTVFCALSLSTTQSHAAECEDGRMVTLSGVISDNDGDIKSGKIWLDVETSSPCSIDFIEYPAADMPASCKTGATFTATGRVEDVFFILLAASSLSCE